MAVAVIPVVIINAGQIPMSEYNSPIPIPMTLKTRNIAKSIAKIMTVCAIIIGNITQQQPQSIRQQLSPDNTASQTL